MEELKQLRKQFRVRTCIYFAVFLAVIALIWFIGKWLHHPYYSFLAMYLVIPLGIFLYGPVLKGTRKKIYRKKAELRRTYKESYVSRTLASVFENVNYVPWMGIPEETIAATKMIDMGDLFHSEDYLSASYKGVCFEQSDVHIQEKRQETDARGDTRTVYVTLFRGRWMIFPFNKRFRANFQIVQNGFLNAKRKQHFGRKETLYKPVETESVAFNQNFQVFAQDARDVFYVVTPAFMERIQRLAAQTNGKLLFCFLDNRLHIAFSGCGDSFEPGSYNKPEAEEAIIRRLREQTDVVTRFVDELRLDNDLFLPDA